MSEKAFTLRIAEELFEKIKISAEKNKRSIAKEIEWILEQTIEHPENQKVLEYIVECMEKSGHNVFIMDNPEPKWY